MSFTYCICWTPCNIWQCIIFTSSSYIRRTCKNYTLPYITWSPTYTICKTHGKVGGQYACCDKAEIYSRVVGYYRPVDRWNDGKKEEFIHKKFLKPIEWD